MQVPALRMPTLWGIISLSLISLLFASCGKSSRPHYIKDNKRQIWSQNNYRINQFYNKYKNSAHVKITLERAQRYLPYIHRVFRKHRLPPELAYLPMLESSFTTDANSGRAVGLWQFTKATAQDYGLTVNFWKDERLDWRKSTEAAAVYLSVLGKRFNYNWELALAAYNGGPNYVAKLMKQQHSWNFWQIRFRPETREYVPKFLAMLRVASRYPQLYYKGAPKFWVATR